MSGFYLALQRRRGLQIAAHEPDAVVLLARQAHEPGATHRPIGARARGLVPARVWRQWEAGRPGGIACCCSGAAVSVPCCGSLRGAGVALPARGSAGLAARLASAGRPPSRRRPGASRGRMPLEPGQRVAVGAASDLPPHLVSPAKPGDGAEGEEPAGLPFASEARRAHGSTPRDRQADTACPRRVNAFALLLAGFGWRLCCAHCFADCIFDGSCGGVF